MESTASSSIAGCIENSRLEYGDKQEGEYYNDNGDGQGGSNDSEHFTSKDKGNSDDVSEQSNNSYYASDNEQSKCIEDDGEMRVLRVIVMMLVTMNRTKTAQRMMMMSVIMNRARV